MRKNALDQAIEQEYYKQAKGVQIDIMDIGKVFTDVRKAVTAGLTLESAMTEAIDKYCFRGA